MTTQDTDVLGKVMERPWCCPEPRCVPIYQVRDGGSQGLARPQPGESFNCWGRLPAEIVFDYDGVPHANALRSCGYTPLKGVVTWHENPEDWALLSHGYQTALDRVTQLDAWDSEEELETEALGDG